MSAEVVSRFNPAAWRWQDLRYAARLWNFNLARAIGLTPTQRNLAWLIGLDTLHRGFFSCCYNRLEDMVCEGDGVPRVLDLSKGNLTEALCGFVPSVDRPASPERAAGLAGFGICRVQWTSVEGQRLWIVTAMPDARLWRCSMVSEERLAQRRRALDRATNQFSPFLTGDGIGPDLDLHDALPAVWAEERANT